MGRPVRCYRCQPDSPTPHRCYDWAWVLVEGHYIGGRYERQPCECPCREDRLW
jgi:hypothetical protein